MNAGDILDVLERAVAPVKVSDELCAKYGMYDNSGLIVNMGGEVSGCLFSLDLSEESVKRAKQGECNLIVTHHPAIFGGIKRIDGMGCGTDRAIAECIKCGISVISMHLNFDAAPEGIDYYLMRGLGGNDFSALDVVGGGAYGRVYDVAPIKLKALGERVRSTFCSDRVIIYGQEDREIRRIASFCGAGCDERAIAFAQAGGADAFVSSDFKHHLIVDLVGRGIAVISLTHYCAEAYGFRRIYENIKNQLGTPSSFFFDDRLA